VQLFVISDIFNDSYRLYVLHTLHTDYQFMYRCALTIIYIVLRETIGLRIFLHGTLTITNIYHVFVRFVNKPETSKALLYIGLPMI